ncbi:MAG: YihY/virulence factor BrkB family protein [Eubacteriales bacterium]|nr:YihY/virulence factor BrkB family protein [Eubacteriales bacterium]
MSKNRFFRMVFSGIRQIRDPYYQGFAAQMSFYFMCAIVPMIIILSQLLIFGFHLQFSDVIAWLMNSRIGSMDNAFTHELQNILGAKGSAGVPANIVYVFIALWAASGVQFCMVRISNYMYTEGRTTGRGYFRERFRSIVTMLIFIVIIMLALLVLLYGQRFLVDALGMSPTIWTVARWPVALLLYILCISFQYYVMPSERLRFREILPGSIFASVGMVIVTMFYSLFLGYRSGISVYGVLSSIIAVMLWFYILAWVLVLGMLFNKVWMDTETDQDPFYFAD